MSQDKVRSLPFSLNIVESGSVLSENQVNYTSRSSARLIYPVPFGTCICPFVETSLSNICCFPDLNFENISVLLFYYPSMQQLRDKEKKYLLCVFDRIIVTSSINQLMVSHPYIWRKNLRDWSHVHQLLIRFCRADVLLHTLDKVRSKEREHR